MVLGVWVWAPGHVLAWPGDCLLGLESSGPVRLWLEGGWALGAQAFVPLAWICYGVAGAGGTNEFVAAGPGG